MPISEKDFLLFVESEYGKVILEMQTGDFFGEKALIENKPRALTVLAKSDCDLMVLEKKDFDIVI